ncbi:MAG: Hsp70 family protein, partial [Lentisphaeria bacterium]|nr:Hsp70 family protein [Lentisphaeria bacterium]NQZ68912.1 Hsp70 family protein [Lentisphaeria bacterium]
DPDSGDQTLTVLGRGSSVIGGTISTTLTFKEMEKVLVDGFFPVCELGDKPDEDMRTGIRTFGLAYAGDPAITKHLAEFISKNSKSDDDIPCHILFNGGVSKATVLKERIVKTVKKWSGKKVTTLEGTHPDLAVALGACWYGNVREGNAIRIKAGCSYSYYIGIESAMPAVPGFEVPLQALCVVPFGLEEGSEVEIPYRGLGLIVGEQSVFQLYASLERQEDEIASIIENSDSEEFIKLPPLNANLKASDKKTPAGTLIPVTLKTILSEAGTLEIWGMEDGGDGEWKLEYDIRGEAE